MTLARKLQEAPSPTLSEISKPCFAAMQSQASLALTLPYHAEELAHIRNLLRNVDFSGGDIDCFVAIGCAQLRYADVAFQHCWNYAAIEPNLEADASKAEIDMMRSLRGIRIVAKNFEDVTKEDLPAGRKLFFFLFNVFPYIKDAEKTLRQLASPGDIVVVSSWNEQKASARKLKEQYYDYLSSQFNCSIADKVDARVIDKLWEKMPDTASNVYRVRGETTDILTYRIKHPEPGMK